MTANQEEISDHETFQLEYESSVSRWYIRTMQDKYFSLGAGGGIQANENKRYSKFLNEEPTLLVHCLFQISPLNHKRTTSSLAPPIIYVAKNSAIKR